MTRAAAVRSAATRTPDDPQAAAAAQAAAVRAARFDALAEERAELQRERATLVALLLAQMKTEDEFLQKLIALI